MSEDLLYNVITEVEETTDDFIFKTIQPFCEQSTQRTISKGFLIKALLHEMEREKLKTNEDALQSILGDTVIIPLNDTKSVIYLDKNWLKAPYRERRYDKCK